MPRRQRARSSVELKAEDFVDSVLNFSSMGGGDEDVEEKERKAGGGDAQPAVGFKSKNLEAERKRRGKLNRNILELRSVVPNITKVAQKRNSACRRTEVEHPSNYRSRKTTKELLRPVRKICNEANKVNARKADLFSPVTVAAAESADCGVPVTAAILRQRKGQEGAGGASNVGGAAMPNPSTKKQHHPSVSVA